MCADMAGDVDLFLTDENGTHPLTYVESEAGWFCCYGVSKPNVWDELEPLCVMRTQDVHVGYFFSCSDGADFPPTLQVQWQRINFCTDDDGEFFLAAGMCDPETGGVYVPNTFATCGPATESSRVPIAATFAIPPFADGVSVGTTPVQGTAVISE